MVLRRIVAVPTIDDAAARTPPVTRDGGPHQHQRAVIFDATAGAFVTYEFSDRMLSVTVTLQPMPLKIPPPLTYPCFSKSRCWSRLSVPPLRLSMPPPLLVHRRC